MNADDFNVRGMKSLWWNILITYAFDIETADARIKCLEQSQERAIKRIKDPKKISDRISSTKTKRSNLLRQKEIGIAMFSDDYGYNYHALNDICDMIGSDADYIRRKFKELTPKQFTYFLKSCDPLRSSNSYHLGSKITKAALSD